MEIVIIVNGKDVVVEKEEICYEQFVEIAFGTYNPNVVYTVLFYAGKSGHEKGSLVKGECKKVHQGMVFNVTITTQS